MQTGSPLNTGLLAAILAGVTQIEIGPHASACAIALANIASAAVLAYLGRRISNSRRLTKQASRQRRQKLRTQHMVSTARRRPQHKASVANAPNGSRSKRQTKKQYA